MYPKTNMQDSSKTFLRRYQQRIVPAPRDMGGPNWALQAGSTAVTTIQKLAYVDGEGWKLKQPEGGLKIKGDES